MSEAAAAVWLAAQVERYEAPVLRYALRMVGDLELARDVTQDTFVRLCQSAAAPNVGEEWGVRPGAPKLNGHVGHVAPVPAGPNGGAAGLDRPGGGDLTLAWLLTVCRNRAIDTLRKRGRQPVMTDLAAGNGSTGMSAFTLERETAASDPRVALEQSDETRRTLERLAKLPANQQEVVRLRFQCGLSYA